MSKREAEKAANEALKLMKSKGWKKRVHENIGWYASLINGGMYISINVYEDGNTYSGLMSGDPKNYPCTGEMCWTRQASSHKSDPNKAAELIVRDARRRLDKCIKVVEEAERVLGIEPKKRKK